MQSSGLSAERRARLVRHFELCMNGHFDQMSLANNNPQPQSAPDRVFTGQFQAQKEKNKLSFESHNL
jgi:hypothetical protein